MSFDIQRVIKPEYHYYIRLIKWGKFNPYDTDSKRTTSSKKLVDISIGNTYHHPIFITYCILNEIKKMKNNCKIISLLPVAMLTLKCIAYSDTPMLFDSNSPCYNLKEMERDYVIKDTDFIVTY